MSVVGVLRNKILPGPDGITNEAIKQIAKIKPEILIGLFNKCLSEGHFP